MRSAMLVATALTLTSLSAEMVRASDKFGALIEKGRSIAEKNCARCHSIGNTGASPLRLAPPFRDLKKRYAIRQLEEALAEGIVTGHKDMPVYAFEPREIDALLTFMESLQPSR